MKTFVLTFDIPNNGVRDSVYVAQMLREAAGTIEYQVPMEDHRHVYDRLGVQKYEWTVEELEPVTKRRVA